MGEIMQTCNGYRMEQWRQIIQDCRESGLSNKAYCELHGISEKTYYYWLRKLRRTIMEQAVPQITEVGPEQTGRDAVHTVSWGGDDAAGRNGHRGDRVSAAVIATVMMEESRGRKYYVACGYTDLRRGIDGLAGMVQTGFKLDPFQNALFLFCGRRKDRLKGLYWEGDGFVLLYKRLELSNNRPSSK